MAVQEEGEKLEADLAARHAAELAALEAATASAAAATDGSDMGSAAIASNSLYGSSTPAQVHMMASKRIPSLPPRLHMRGADPESGIIHRSLEGHEPSHEYSDFYPGLTHPKEASSKRPGWTV